MPPKKINSSETNPPSNKRKYTKKDTNKDTKKNTNNDNSNTSIEKSINDLVKEQYQEEQLLIISENSEISSDLIEQIISIDELSNDVPYNSYIEIDDIKINQSELLENIKEPVQEEPELPSEPFQEEPELPSEPFQEPELPSEPVQEESELPSEPVQEEPELLSEPVQEPELPSEAVQEPELPSEPVQEPELLNDINTIINNLVIENADINNYILNESSLNNILEYLPSNNKYSIIDLKNIFNQFNEAILLVQIIDGKIKFIEKKGYESRNQSAIELLIKTNEYKVLPNISVLIFTNDYIESEPLKDYNFIYTFCNNSSYNTTLFPNFNFNHWNEANIGNYEDTYNFFKNNQIEWNIKKDTIFWSGADTNIIRRKIFLNTLQNPLYEINLTNITKRFIPITNITKYKYLLNMNGYSYSGRLNYLFLSGSCIIQLKNTDPLKSYNEFYYKYFIPDIDYIEIPYNDNTPTSDILNLINEKINTLNPEIIAQNGYRKAIEILNIYNIYEYIYQTLTENESQYIKNETNEMIMDIDKSFMYIPDKKVYINRLPILNNSVNFTFKGNDILIKLSNSSSDPITFTIAILKNVVIILLNNKQIYQRKILQLSLTISTYNNMNIEFINNNIVIKNNNYVIIQIPNPIQWTLFDIMKTEFSSSSPSWIIY